MASKLLLVIQAITLKVHPFYGVYFIDDQHGGYARFLYAYLSVRLLLADIRYRLNDQHHRSTSAIEIFTTLTI